MDADDVIRHLGLQPHPEGGWYRETWRHEPEDGSRGAGTAIYFLLAEGDRSHWHRVDADEVWHHYAGDPLRLRTWAEGGGLADVVLGPDLASGEAPQETVPRFTWQSAEPLGRWTLVGCTVSPAFEFSGFELAPPGWQPPIWGVS
jgi:predicted cupin superfamily sugar epimerase